MSASYEALLYQNGLTIVGIADCRRCQPTKVAGMRKAAEIKGLLAHPRS
jgi:hypothetical protein